MVREDKTLQDCCTIEEEGHGLLRTVFYDGQLQVDESLKNIRKRLVNQVG